METSLCEKLTARNTPGPPVIRPTPRLVFIAVFLACAGLIGFALYLQEEIGLDPCPLCILQRYAFIVIGLVALIGAIHGPRRGPALKIYGTLTGLFALAGGGTSVRQVWLQHNPPKSVSCGADLEGLLQSLPLSQALPQIFSG